MSTWVFSFVTGVYNYWTVVAPWCHPVPPSSDSEAATNPELISIPLNSLLSPSSSPSPQVWSLQKVRFLLPHSHGVAFHSYGVSSFFYIKPVHLISSKGRLILGGLGYLIVSSPWCLSRSNTWVLRLLSWVPFPGPQLTIL